MTKKKRSSSQRPKQTAKKVTSQARQVRIVEGLLTGQTLTEIARKEGVSRVWLSKQANGPEVRQRIAQLVDACADRVEALFVRLLQVCEEGMQALDYKNATVNLDGEVIAIGAPPDHYARLAAGKRFLELVTIGRPPAASDAAKGPKTVTIDELEALLKAQSEKPLQ